MFSQGLEASQNLETQETRLRRCGFSNVRSWLMLQVYQSLLRSGLRRIEAIDFKDEHELLQWLLNHYCVTVADDCESSLGFDEIRLHPVPTVAV